MTMTRRGFLQRALATATAAIVLPTTLEDNAAEARRLWPGHGPGRWQMHQIAKAAESYGRLPSDLVGHLHLHDTSAEALREAERNLTADLERARAGWQIRYRAQDGEFTDWSPLERTQRPGEFAIGQEIALNAGVAYEFQIWQPESISPPREPSRWHARPLAPASIQRLGPYTRGRMGGFVGEAISDHELRVEL